MYTLYEFPYSITSNDCRDTSDKTAEKLVIDRQRN
jgi:hypothetical protein